jgi:uncharacterized membrane protein YfcA
MSLYFTLGTVLSITALWLAGAFGRHELALSLVLLPGTALGFLASGPLLHRVDAARLRVLVLAAATLSALVLLVTALI